MAKRRIINTKFWSDNYIGSLDPSEKLLFLYFLTNPYTNIAGAYEISLKQVALDTGFDKEMVDKILRRFRRDKKIIYKEGYVVIKNFIRHQEVNPKVQAGIKAEMEKLPDSIREIVYDSLSYPNSNLNSNSNIKNVVAEAPTPFSLKEEIQKLEDNPRRELQVIGLYLKQRIPDIRTKAQLSAAIKRHVRAAKQLSPFDDDQIIKAFRKAKEQTPEWVIETALKMATK